MKKSFLLLLTVLICQLSFSQKKAFFDAKRLKVTWETVENNYKGSAETYSKLTLTNLSGGVFPA
ncbi:MAG TPA: hypothetical protein VF679_02875, partial [Pedobacter sp.]